MLRCVSHAVGRRALPLATQIRAITVLRHRLPEATREAPSARSRAPGPLAVLSRRGLVGKTKLRLGSCRMGMSTLTDEELRRKMDDFNDLFVTAREEMEYADESKETTYFDEEAAAAKEAVDAAVALFEEVLNSVGDEKRTEIMRGSGLRVEQLKAELDQLLASDDH